MHRLVFLSVALVFIICSCNKHHKGDMFTSTVTGDSQQYIILKKGSGERLLDAAKLKKMQSNARGDSCEIKYLTDTMKLSDQKGLLLFNTQLPDIKNDFLEKGFFGTFSSKQVITLILVSEGDLGRYFKKTSNSRQ